MLDRLGYSFCQPGLLIKFAKIVPCVLVERPWARTLKSCHMPWLNDLELSRWNRAMCRIKCGLNNPMLESNSNPIKVNSLTQPSYAVLVDLACVSIDWAPNFSCLNSYATRCLKVSTCHMSSCFSRSGLIARDLVWLFQPRFFIYVSSYLSRVVSIFILKYF
jgi:hypothetical protein